MYEQQQRKLDLDLPIGANQVMTLRRIEEKLDKLMIHLGIQNPETVTSSETPS